MLEAYLRQSDKSPTCGQGRRMIINMPIYCHFRPTSDEPCIQKKISKNFFCIKEIVLKFLGVSSAISVPSSPFPPWSLFKTLLARTWQAWKRLLRIQLSQGKTTLIEKFLFWTSWDSISCVTVWEIKNYIISKLYSSEILNWLFKVKYSYSKSEYELFMGKKEAPLLDTDL